ncbi:MAG: hypothetical protein KGJ41_01800 [Rhodospirillales bacterium]|nr:hypothetical protein [Rhodospirillales bacterium]
MHGPDHDDLTVRLRPGRPSGGGAARRRALVIAAALAALLAVLGAGGFAWQAWRSAPAPRGAAHFAIRDATEAQILANDAGALTVFRFIPNPRVLVLDFASLHTQAQMLNRVAALTEKSGLPRDRLLDDAALASAIRAAGETPDTYYYGHDYSAAELRRFFRLAAADGTVLTAEEQRLRELLAEVGFLRPGALGAIISIPHVGADKLVDRGARATILHHELSHGEYFSNPVYAEYVHQFWRGAMQPADRAAFTRFLASEAYDGSDLDLMMNETQAYLMHTPDPRFFNAASVGMSEAALDRLRTVFLRGMPPGWLRDDTHVPPVPPAAAAASR